MSGLYLEDFAVGQTFGSGRLRVDKERIKSFAAESIRSPSTSTKRPRAARYSVAWRRAAGTPPR
jgi:hypothetical protein